MRSPGEESDSAMSHPLSTGSTASDADSDYGGDFSQEELVIIDRLIEDIALADVASDQPLELTRLEDDEEPRGVLLPRTLGKAIRLPGWMQQSSRNRLADRSTSKSQISNSRGATAASNQKHPPLPEIQRL